MFRASITTKFTFYSASYLLSTVIELAESSAAPATQQVLTIGYFAISAQIEAIFRKITHFLHFFCEKVCRIKKR